MSLFASRAELSAHRFGTSTAFRVGVEEELFLVDARTLRLSASVDAVLAATSFTDGRAVGEICDGVIEFVTPVCDTAAGAVASLASLRGAARAAGATVLGAGVHPDMPFGEVVHRRGARYERISDATRAPLRQTPYAGVHVHVGMPDPETCIRAMNGMRRWAPVLRALAGNSPYWRGTDSGMASARAVLCSSLPRTGMPPALRDYEHFAAMAEALCRAAELDDYGEIWWDLRPHPRLGTLELRCLDAQSSLDDLTGIVALAHCLAVHESRIIQESPPATELLAEASFRAARDGLDATLDVDGEMRPVREHVRRALTIAARHATDLGYGGELACVERMLAEGNGAMRQRQIFERGGMPALLRHLVEETAAPAATCLIPEAA